MEDGSIWSSLGGIGLTAILTTIGTFVITRYSIRSEAQTGAAARQEEIDRHARYLAMRVVCVLDPFIRECVEVVHDSGLLDNEGVMEPRMPDPMLTFPDDVDWRSVQPDLMYRILGFPNELEIAKQAISWVVDQISGPPDYTEFFQERVIRYGKLGLAAVALADDLRRVYGIPPRDYGDWHPKEVIEEQVVETEKKKAEAEARQAQHTREMMERYEAKNAANATKDAE
jgi:hypothetical protein